MNEIEAKKCPKCRGKMEHVDKIITYGFGAAKLVGPGDMDGPKIAPFCCSSCGYIELYNEKFLKK
jgi:predicted nucleic-acid-binding Zn-ribbon protein